MLKVTFELLGWVLYICENIRDEAVLVLLNPQTSRARSCSEMHQAPIPKAVTFSLAPVRGSPVAQPSKEERGEPLHQSAFHPALLLSPVAAADINKHKMQRGFVCRWGDLQDLLKSDWRFGVCIQHGGETFVWLRLLQTSFSISQHTSEMLFHGCCVYKLTNTPI